MQVQGFLPKFGNVTVAIRQEVIEIEYANPGFRKVSISTAYINDIPVSGEEAEVVANLIRSANGELNATDFHPNKAKEAKKILKKVQRRAKIHDNFIGR